MRRFCILTCLVFMLAPTTPAQARAGEKSGVKHQTTSETSQKKWEMQQIEIEFELKKLEIEAAIAETTAEEAETHIAMAELQLAKARDSGEGYSVAAAEIQLKQAQIRARGQRLRTEIARLNLERAKVHVGPLLQSGKPEETHETKAATQAKSRGKRKRGGKKSKAVPVQLEVVEGAEAVIIRGPKASIERLRKLIETASKRR